MTAAPTPNSIATSALTRKANILAMHNKLPEALDCFENTLRINPNNTLALNDKAYVFERQNKFPQALGCFEKVLTINPTNTLALNGRARMLQLSNRPLPQNKSLSG